MKKLFVALLLSTTFVPVLAEPSVRPKTANSQGCMLMRECTRDVVSINTTADMGAILTESDYSDVQDEADALILNLKQMGVGVYLAPDRYFLPRTAGVYYTVGNDLFLNDSYVDDPQQFITTLRHEAWHAAQDAMAGTIENNNLAIIRMEEDVPRRYVISTQVAYSGNPAVIPWEKEAKWAGGTPGMTLEVLEIINRTNNRPWEEITPTPLTREWLVRKGFINN